MKFNFTLSAALLFATLQIINTSFLFAQTVLTLQPAGAAGTDATLSNFPGETLVNFGTNQEFISESKSISFTPYAKRGLIRFDLSSIPSNATVISAYLSLYAFNPGTGGHLVANNNTGYLFKVTQPWNESTVTWGTQPSYSTADTLILPISDSSNQNYLNVDVRNQIQNMVALPAGNYGFLFKQKFECICNGRMIFGSSDNATSALRPKLVVVYAICSGPPPAASLSPSGTATICFGTTQTFTANAGTGYSYQWFKNGVFISGGSANTFAATSSGIYSVKVTNPQGCTSVSSGTTLTVSLENAKITTSAGSTTVGCANGGLTLNATASGTGNNFLWRLNGSPIIPSPNSPTYTNSLTGNFSCTITNSTGTCSYLTNTILSQTQVANMNTSGSSYFCNNNSFDITVMSVNIGTSRTYQWQQNGTNIPGATNFSYSATTTGDYQCIIDDQMCAGNTLSPIYTVTTGVPPLIEIYSPSGSSPVNLCNGQSTEMWLRDAITHEDWILGGAQWYKNGVALAFNGGIPYLGFIQETGVYTADLTTSCGVSSIGFPGFLVHSTNTPAPAIAPTGSVTACVSQLLYDPNYFYGSWTTYQWQLNGVNIPGATSDSYTPTQSGSYRLVFGNGCGTIPSAPTNVTIGAAAIATAMGPVNFCGGGSVILNANTGAGLTYQWKKYGNVIAGATNASYTATSTGNYKVVVTNAGGCSAGSNTITVTAFPLPVATITATGPTTFCPGGSVQLQAPTGTGLTYQWKKYSLLLSGATSASYTATAAGQYKVIVTNSNGCSKSSNTITVSTLPTSVATITAGGPTSFCLGDSVVLTANAGAGLGYQWKNGTVNIVGATNINYSAKTTGNYRCTVTNTNGCTKNSNAIAVSVPCRMTSTITDNTFNEISIYPNPSSGNFHVSSPHYLTPSDILITDLSGKITSAKIYTADDNYIVISGMAPGVYLISIQGINKFKQFKIVKTE